MVPWRRSGGSATASERKPSGAGQRAIPDLAKKWAACSRDRRLPNGAGCGGCGPFGDPLAKLQHERRRGPCPRCPYCPVLSAHKHQCAGGADRSGEVGPMGTLRCGTSASGPRVFGSTGRVRRKRRRPRSRLLCPWHSESWRDRNSLTNSPRPRVCATAAYRQADSSVGTRN